MGCELSCLHLVRKAIKQRPPIVEVDDMFPNNTKTDSRKSSIFSDMFPKKKVSIDRASSGTVHGLIQNGLLKRNSVTRHRTTEDLEAVVANRVCVRDYFTEFETDVLVSTWAVLGNEAMRHGTFIFSLATEMFPALKVIFGLEFDETSMMVCNEPGLKHCQNYMNIINEAIKSLEHPDTQIYDKLLVAGARYATLPGMKTEYFKVLARATLTTWESLLAEEYTETVKCVWHTFINYVIVVMSEGCKIFEKEEEMAMIENLPSEAAIRLLRSRPSVVSMTPQEWKSFHSTCR